MKKRLICSIFYFTTFFNSSTNAESLKIEVDDVLDLATYNKVHAEEIPFDHGCKGTFKVSNWNWQPTSSEISYNYSVAKQPSDGTYTVQLTKEVTGDWGTTTLFEKEWNMYPGETQAVNSHYRLHTDLILRQTDKIPIEP